MHESTKRFLDRQVAILRAQAQAARQQAEFDHQAMECHLADAIRKEELAEDYQNFLKAEEAEA